MILQNISNAIKILMEEGKTVSSLADGKHFQRTELHPESSPCQEHKTYQSKVPACPGALPPQDPTRGMPSVRTLGSKGPGTRVAVSTSLPASPAQPLKRLHKTRRARETHDISGLILSFWRCGHWDSQKLDICPCHTANEPLSWGSNPCFLLSIRLVFFPETFFFFNHKRK